MKHSAFAVMCRCFAVVFGLVVLLSVTGCEKQPSGPVLVKTEDRYNPYAEIILSAMPEYEPKKRADNVFEDLHGQNILACYDVQAVPAVRQDVGKYWYPQCLATVVIVADRNQTSCDIDGWQNLFESGLPVSWNAVTTAQPLLLGALSYGLEGENYNRKTALQKLQKLYKDGNCLQNQWDAPLMVCLDYQAVAMIREGRNLEIIVPKEGTFSFALGLLAQEILPAAVTDDALLAGGFRLPDGRSSDPAYPPYASYEPAVRVKDFHHFAAETNHYIREIRRIVRHERTYSSADTREHILFAMAGMIAAVAWMGSAVQRSIRPDIQRAIELCALLIVGWLTIRLLKYQFYNSTGFVRICWYGYYVFQMALPLNVLYITSVFDRPESNGRPPHWFYAIAALYPVLLAFVLTNDLHQLVFRFDLHADWSNEYTYGFIYYIVYLYCNITFFVSVLILIRKSWKSPKRIGWCFPVLFGGLIIIYSFAYTLNIPFARDSDYTLTVCSFGILFFESALRTGLVPSNTRYTTLFRLSPLNMQLLDHQGRTQLASSHAEELEPVLRVQLQSRPSVSVSRDENTLLFARAIHGGTVVWQEDIGALNRLHHKIKASVERLQAANMLLRKEEEIRRQRVAAEFKADLFASLEREIEEKTDELSQKIRQLPEAGNREQQVAYITLLLCHIKRRCNLFFLAQEGREMAGEELAIYLDELAEFAGYSGIHALVRCGVSDMMDIRAATLCYDFYFAVLAWSVQQSRATLLGQLEKKDGIVFSVLSSEDASDLLFTESLRRGVQEAGGSLSVRRLEDTAGIYLTFPQGGTADE